MLVPDGIVRLHPVLSPLPSNQQRGGTQRGVDDCLGIRGRVLEAAYTLWRMPLREPVALLPAGLQTLWPKPAEVFAQGHWKPPRIAGEIQTARERNWELAEI